MRESSNCGLGRIDFLAEGRGGCGTARGVPASRRLSFFEGLAEVFKLAGHGRLPRGCDDGPPTRGWSRRSRHRPVRAAPESPPTTPLPRPDLPRDRGFESAGPPAQPALHPRGGAPRPTAVRDPSQERNTGPGTPRDVREVSARAGDQTVPTTGPVRAVVRTNLTLVVPQRIYEAATRWDRTKSYWCRSDPTARGWLIRRSS